MTQPRPRRRMTPHDVRSVTFAASRFGARGYRESDVDEFVEMVAQALADRDREIAREREEVFRIRDWRQSRGVPEVGARTPSPAEVQLYARAQLRAEELENRAGALLTEAEEAARRRFDEILRKATEQARALGAQAQSVAAQMETQLSRLIEEVRTLRTPVEPKTETPEVEDIPHAYRSS